MKIDHYTNLSYYRVSFVDETENPPEISGTAYSLFGTEFDDLNELADIYAPLVDQTIPLKGKKIYLCRVTGKGFETERVYHYYKLWRKLERKCDLKRYKLGKEYLIHVGDEDLYCGGAEIPPQELSSALKIVLGWRFTSFLYITDEEKDFQGDTMKKFFMDILKIERQSIRYDYVRLFKYIKEGEAIVDTSTDGERWAMRIEVKA